MPIKINKPLGMTPLELITEYKKKNNITEKMSFAGRLDPMAHGEMILLIGNECKNQNQYCGKDKIYRFEILKNIKTDSLDILGIFENIENIENIEHKKKYIGKFKQKYPKYSSINVNGKPLWWWSKKKLLYKIEIPEKEVEIYNSKLLETTKIKSNLLLQHIKLKLSKLSEKSKKNFRYYEILHQWEKKLNNENNVYDILKYEMKVSSGTYIRKICEEMGGIAYDIERINII